MVSEMQSFEEQIEIFFGATSGMESQIYARITGCDGVRLTGHVRGPYCAYANTLPTDFALRPLGTENTTTVHALVADPCFWTPELPFLYDVTITVAAEGREQETVQRKIGIRPLAVAANDFRYAGRRYVMRMVDLAMVAEAFCDRDELLAVSRKTGTGLLAGSLEESLAVEASREGVLLAARVEGDDEEMVTRALRRLARWPAVAMAVLDDRIDLPRELSQRAPNLILACQLTRTLQGDPPAWAQVLLVDQVALQRGDVPLSAITQPVIVIKQLAAAVPLLEARRFCDDLQRETAPLGDLAGYIVGCREGAF